MSVTQELLVAGRAVYTKQFLLRSVVAGCYDAATRGDSDWWSAIWPKSSTPSRASLESMRMADPVLALRFVNVMLSSVMLGCFLFGAASVAEFHRKMAPRDAWRLHRFVSRRVDWFIPASTFLAMLTGFALLIVDTTAARTVEILTLAGASAIALYGAPFLVLPQGLQTELTFVRCDIDELQPHEARCRMRWWNGMHYYRTVLGAVAHTCFVLAALLR